MVYGLPAAPVSLPELALIPNNTPVPGCAAKIAIWTDWLARPEVEVESLQR
jgi:hypothetical protein